MQRCSNGIFKDWQNHTKRLLWQLLYDRYEGKWPELLRDWVAPGSINGFESLRDAGAALKLRPGGDGIKLINDLRFFARRGITSSCTTVARC